MSTKKDETRLRLLNAARKLLVKRGFHAVGLEDIAEAAGVSRQAVYKTHFASKADLLLSLVRHVDEVENIAELVRPVIEANSAIDMLRASIAASVNIQGRVHDIALVVGAAAHSDAGAATAFRDRMEQKRGALRTALTRLKSDGRLDPAWTVEQAVDTVAALLSVDTYQELVVERGWKPEALIDKVWALCTGSIVRTRRIRRD